jgi:hypothetical protein
MTIAFFLYFRQDIQNLRLENEVLERQLSSISKIGPVRHSLGGRDVCQFADEVVEPVDDGEALDDF